MDPKELATGYLAALGGDDPDAVIAFVAEDFRNEHFSALGATSVGRAEYGRRLPGFMASFRGRRYSVDDVVVESRGGDAGAPEAVAVVRYRLTADCDGGAIDIPGMMWLRVRGERIAHRIDCWDSLTFLRQTGAEQS
jgi:ketosteroid isomerase-like protein